MNEKTIVVFGLPNRFLNVENITDAPDGGGLWWCLLTSRYERCFFDEFVRPGGLTVSVRGEDSYSIFGVP
jgi:hypothetical protein